MAEPFQGGSREWGMGSGRALSGREWGMGNGEWQSPMDATHALLPYSLLTTPSLLPPLGHGPIRVLS
jgi:hypothetical protein